MPRPVTPADIEARWRPLSEREATKRVYADAQASYAKPMTDEERKVLFGAPAK